MAALTPHPSHVRVHAASSIDTPAVRRWHVEIARTRPTTAAKAYRLMSSIMRTAVTDGILESNPCQIRGAAVERAPERPIATMAEVDQLAELMPPELRIAVVLAAWCQLRRGEVRGLRRKDVDLERGLLTVEVTRTTAMSGRTIVKEPKTRAGRRSVAIPPNALEPLAAHIDAHVGGDADSSSSPGPIDSECCVAPPERSRSGRPPIPRSPAFGPHVVSGDRCQCRRADAACRSRVPGGRPAVPARDRRT